MSSPEQIFSTSVLDLIIPDDLVSLPSSDASDEWLGTIINIAERKQAFFDEKLQFFLTIRLLGEPPSTSGSAPLVILNYLTHLQIALDATYVSPVQSAPSTPKTARLAPAPASILKKSPRGSSPSFKPRPPPLFPPHTPNPTPQTADPDKKYVASEGVQLYSYIWGENGPADDRKDEFALIWSSSEKVWVAIYRLQVSVAFMRTRVPDPILCLTVSITLRDKPLVVTQARAAVAALLTAAGGDITPPILPTTPNGTVMPPPEDSKLEFIEVNLLEGLVAGTTFANHSEKTNSLNLPTTRAPSAMRRDAYSLPELRFESPAPAPAPSNRFVPTLRKSFRKTLSTVSGFRVRMRTVFVPYVLVPGSGEDDDEMRVAGSEERTVVLCVEIENSGESGSGFAVEGVDIIVGGEGAKAKLIGWGDKPTDESSTESVFPLLLRTLEQYNLLYGVSFIHPSDSTELTLNSRSNNNPPPPSADLQRNVAIIVKGRPFETEGSNLESENLAYPTNTFSSRWNCILDLSSSRQELGSPIDAYDALPNPASPFPSSSPRFHMEHEYNQTYQPSIAGSKRHTFGALTTKRSPLPITTNFRASTPGVSMNGGQFLSPKFTPTLPSIAVNAPGSNPSSPAPLHTSGFTSGFSPSQQIFGNGAYFAAPPTPAYPAYPSESLAPPTPFSQAPISGFTGGGIGQFVEPRRERKSLGGIPPTPGPRAFGSSFSEKMTMLEPYAEPVVVSVALLPPSLHKRISSEHTQSLPLNGSDRIYPLDVFALEIFVFNQSPVTRRFEVSFPDRKKKKQNIAASTANSTLESSRYTVIGGQAGIMPLENRIRVGPLRPQTCQSVRMQFVALHAGLHSVDTLTITDTEAEFSLNLRSVMDIVVSDP